MKPNRSPTANTRLSSRVEGPCADSERVVEALLPVALGYVNRLAHFSTGDARRRFFDVKHVFVSLCIEHFEPRIFWQKQAGGGRLLLVRVADTTTVHVPFEHLSTRAKLAVVNRIGTANQSGEAEGGCDART